MLPLATPAAATAFVSYLKSGPSTWSAAAAVSSFSVDAPASGVSAPWDTMT